MRLYFYILAGLISALLGWNIAQVFLSDFGWLQGFPEIVLFPCMAISLAIGSVTNEIFISNPTRPKLSVRMLRVPLMLAFMVGLIAGGIAGGISQILFDPSLAIPPVIIRVFGWLVVGGSVGLAEGLSWRFHSLEAGNPKRFYLRLFISILAASIASLIAAGIFELMRLLRLMPAAFKPYEDPLGFAVLGLCLGVAFAITNASPTYLPALRAGSGFEYQEEDHQDISVLDEDSEDDDPKINSSMLRFITYRSHDEFDDEKIEEGMSIELPRRGMIRIGSSVKSENKADIYLPHLLPYLANIKIEGNRAFLTPHKRQFLKIAINGTKLRSRRKVSLKHNYVITFYTEPSESFKVPKFYRFVFYNRFFDPMA
ncbi:MAG: hypothetical protein P5694_00150 [Limnospira sp. PMC 1286.21]|uniref:hypothetical protein n=1 Tax=unclassified Limnospira TaxID=2642885 RepID=UPI0028E0DFD8|nr:MULTISPECIES: hypothetical protein [unclassified Limnospira]MDT9196750.1 hypothetical protein [Limnospira sp. PMC 1042.18]MDT9298671.1 hypothetical protein [Limnospira sp. PMC 1281.21]MDT9319056.1 hypothetical protein [Limnospira sp. PMC 1290.21]MDT9324136.1 hypothetical protein [Limnospira sp. PMC 1286.21]